MDKQQDDKDWGASEHAAVGVGVGAAGLGSSIGLIGLSAGIAALPFSIVAGAIGGLVWWAAKKAGK